MGSSPRARITWMATVLGLSLAIFGSLPKEVKAQSVELAPGTANAAPGVPKFRYVPLWPKPLQDKWVFGELGGTCVDAQDHVFVLSRGDLWPKEEFIATPAPAVVEFDPEGNVVNSWGKREVMPRKLHGCSFDSQGNFWIAGEGDAVVQEYTHDGSKMLLQIGVKGKFDSADGTISGAPPMNSSHTLLNKPTGVAVDPSNGDVYISDGNGNHRVVVFDREGHFLRQWGRQGSMAEVDAGVGGVFLKIVHCVNIGNDGLVYVCDRTGDRIEIFDKMGNYKKSWVVVGKWGAPPHTGPGVACSVGFSPDPAQKFAYIADCSNDEVHIMDRATGKELSNFGRPGHGGGYISSPHSLAVDSKGNIYIGGSLDDRRLQKFELVK